MNNMKKKFLLNIQSQSDIITNSSTEVFILNNENSAVEELMNELLKTCKHWVKVLKTEEDVKQYLLDNFDAYGDGLEEIDDMLDFNPLLHLNDHWTFDPAKMEEYGFTREKLVDFFFEPYKKLVGKAILSFADDCGVPDEIWYFTDAVRTNKLVEHFSR